MDGRAARAPPAGRGRVVDAAPAARRVDGTRVSPRGCPNGDLGRRRRPEGAARVGIREGEARLVASGALGLGGFDGSGFAECSEEASEVRFQN